MADPRSAAQTAIAQAGFTPATERNAMRLLDCAANENGSVTLTWAALCEIWQLSDAGAARRYLTRLSRAGIIHYSSNEWIYITFRTWAPTTGAWELPNRRVGTTESARGNYPSEENESPDAPTETDDNPTTARGNYQIGAWELPNRRVGTTKSARGGGIKGGGMNERVLSSPLPVDDFIQSIPEAEQKATIAILTDPAIRLGAWKAKQIAERHSFAIVRAYCCDYVAQGKRPLDDAGLIDWWLKNEPVPPLVVGELYRRHRTPAEIAAEVEEQRQTEEQRIRWEAEDAAKAAQAASEPAPQPQPAPAPTEPRQKSVDVWGQVLARLAATLPAATFDQWVKATSLLGVEDGLYTVGTSDALTREWLHNRLNQAVQRALSGVVGRSVTVQFVVKSTGGETADVREN